MKTDPTRRPSRSIRAALFLAAVAAGGCHAPRTDLALRSYRDPFFPEDYRVRLADCTYRVVADNDLLVVACAERRLPDGTAAMQYLSVTIYWRPWPGRTFVDSAMHNAALRYVVANADGVNVYRGVGFAYLRDRDDLKAGRLDVALEAGTLRLESRSGNLVDFLGEATVSGELRANERPADTVRIQREVERLAAR